MPTTCPECREPIHGASCAACGWSRRKTQAAQPVVSGRYSYLQPKREDAYCRIHKAELDATGFCRVAQAWWYPRFACPACHGWLWDNGFCPSCTPRTRMFPGDYFEARFDADAGREYGHYVRVHRGPTPALTDEQVSGYIAQVRALSARITMRQPGEDPIEEEVPF